MKKDTTLKMYSEENVKNSDDSQLFLMLEEAIEDNLDNVINLIVVDKQRNKIESGNLLIISNYLKVIISLDSISDDIPLKSDIQNRTLIVKNTEIEEIKNIHMKRMLQEVIKNSIDEQKNGQESKH